MLSTVSDQKATLAISNKPFILAPAGNQDAFLAALAAGADAIYCGLKAFSARMEAKNFSIEQLTKLTRLAHQKKTQVYVALNSLIKPDELESAGKIMHALAHRVQPDAVIVQDLAFFELSRQMGFKGQLHLSTLANVSFPAALDWIDRCLGAMRVVVPRELSIDEIKQMAAACPARMDLEVFVHGALCYGVSGRCYWSSWLGGKSGLRGRCVQPCRRLYKHKKERQRFFACQDLSVDVLAKVLKECSPVKVWKIEGRKKGPHYVYYVVSAYRLLRDQHSQPARKRDALDLLQYSLGRENTHYNFLPQRPQNPVKPDRQTGSGLLLGRVQGGSQKAYLIPRIALLPGDVLRIGYEDEKHHTIQRINRHLPKKGRLHLKINKTAGNLKGAPVFLTDRREKALEEMIKRLQGELEDVKLANPLPSRKFEIRLPVRKKENAKTFDLNVFRNYGDLKKRYDSSGLWLSESNLKQCPKKAGQKMWWWLPPVIWPLEQEALIARIERARRSGSRNFVLNAPWQMAFFPDHKTLNLWAGPFCNLANPLALSVLKSVGFKGVIVSPELGKGDYEVLARNAPLTLGVVIAGHWPVAISRVLADDVRLSESFSSPKEEVTWVDVNDDDYWMFPNWRLNLVEKRAWLVEKGYRLFVHLNERVPAKVNTKERPGIWNWEVGLR